MKDGQEPIADDEILFRRISVASDWYDPTTGIVKPAAFFPHKTEDTTGLSLSREKYASIEQAAHGRSGKSYYVARLRAGAIRAAGIAIEPRPETPAGYDPAHLEMPELNSGNRKDNLTLERANTLASLKLDVHGPYPTP